MLHQAARAGAYSTPRADALTALLTPMKYTGPGCLRQETHHQHMRSAWHTAALSGASQVNPHAAMAPTAFQPRTDQAPWSRPPPKPNPTTLQLHHANALQKQVPPPGGPSILAPQP